MKIKPKRAHASAFYALNSAVFVKKAKRGSFEHAFEAILPNLLSLLPKLPTFQKGID